MDHEDYSPPTDVEIAPVLYKKPVPHYYGDLVRRLFLICGFIMIATLPFLKSQIPASVFYSLLLILILVFLAGMTNPRIKWIIGADIVVSFIGFAIFGYHAISRFAGVRDLFSATNFTLAVIFLFAFYYSIKTLRGMQFPERISMFKEIRESSENIVEPYKSPQVIEPQPKHTPPPNVEEPDGHLSDIERRVKRFKGEESE